MKITFDQADIDGFRGPDAVIPTFECHDFWNVCDNDVVSVATQSGVVRVGIINTRAKHICDTANAFFAAGKVTALEIEITPECLRLSGQSSEANLGHSWHRAVPKPYDHMREGEDLCEEYKLGTPGRGDCVGDGHYLCGQCVNKDREAQS